MKITLAFLGRALLLYALLFVKRASNRLIIGAFAFGMIEMARAATGDVIAAEIQPDGYSIKITFEGLNTGGTYDHKLVTKGWANNVPTAQTPFITFTAPGYNASGNAVNVTRTAHVQVSMRQAYPNHASKDEVFSGGNVTIRFALSRYVYSIDSSVTLTMPPGVYTQGGTPSNACTAFAVTNSSTETPGKPVGHWTEMPLRRIIGNTVKLRMFADDGTPERMAAAVKFSITDGSTTVTGFATKPTSEAAYGDKGQSPEWIASIDCSTLNSGPITCRYEVFPSRGNSSAHILDSGDGVNTMPTWKYASHTNLLDKAGTYCGTFAYVSAAGSDTTGVVSTTAATAKASPFLTIGKAAAALQATNSILYSRNNPGGGTVRLRSSDSFTWTGSSQTFNDSETYVTIETDPADSGQATINAVGNGSTMGKAVCWRNINIAPSSAVNLTANITYFWLDRCTVNAANASTLTSITSTNWSILYMTDCNVVSITTGIRPTGSGNCPVMLVRGCAFTNFVNKVNAVILMGNLKVGTNAHSTSWWEPKGTSTTVEGENWIAAGNKVYDWEPGTSGTFLFSSGSAAANTHGGAICQNVLEQIGTGNTPGIFYLAADDSVVEVNNIFLRNNTTAGGKNNICYSDKDTNNVPRKRWMGVANLGGDNNTKHDDHNGASGQSGNRVGAWPFGEFGVNRGWSHWGELNLAPFDIGTASFVADFGGLSSVWIGAGFNTRVHGFVNDLSSDGANVGTGKGDYRISTKSVLLNGSIPIPNAVPYDIDGQPRGEFDPPGAYATSPRKSVFVGL